MKTNQKNQNNSSEMSPETKKSQRKLALKPPRLRYEFQMKTLLTTRFMKPLHEFMKYLNITDIGKILKQNIRYAFKSGYPNLRIDYSKLILSMGNLPIAPGISVSSPKAGKLEFCWTDNSGIGKALATDQVFVAVYSRESQRWIYKLNAACRSLGHCRIDIRPIRGKRIQTYIGFVSSDGKRISNSLFMGEVNVF
jgi:hypothetical protein